LSAGIARSGAKGPQGQELQALFGVPPTAQSSIHTLG